MRCFESLFPTLQTQRKQILKSSISLRTLIKPLDSARNTLIAIKVFQMDENSLLADRESSEQKR